MNILKKYGMFERFMDSGTFLGKEMIKNEGEKSELRTIINSFEVDSDLDLSINGESFNYFSTLQSTNLINAKPGEYLEIQDGDNGDKYKLFMK